MDLEEYQRVLARNYVLYIDGETGVSCVAETVAEEYGVHYQVFQPEHSSAGVLLTANAAIKKAAETLQREAPTGKHYYSHPTVYLQTLLQRNYRIVAKANTIFAFGHLERDCKSLLGGTGWSVQMALDLDKRVFVYDIETTTWFRAERLYGVDPVSNLLKMETKFCVWLKPQLPVLDQSSAVIGSRHIGPITSNAIRNLFHRTFCAPDNIQEIRKVLKEFEL